MPTRALVTVERLSGAGLNSTPPRLRLLFSRSDTSTGGREGEGGQTDGRERKERPSWEKARGDEERQETETASRCSLGPSANKHMQGCLPPPRQGTQPSQHPGSSRAPPRAPLYLPHPAWACGLPAFPAPDPRPPSSLRTPRPVSLPLLSPSCGLPVPRALTPGQILSAMGAPTTPVPITRLARHVSPSCGHCAVLTVQPH